MHLLKAIFWVALAITLWVLGPIIAGVLGIIFALFMTVVAVIVIRFILKEHADVTSRQGYR